MLVCGSRSNAYLLCLCIMYDDSQIEIQETAAVTIQLKKQRTMGNKAKEPLVYVWDA